MPDRITSLHLEGFRGFRELDASFGPLTVIAGANGSGKSSLFQFLRFLRDGMEREIPPEIIPGSVGRNVFHLSSRDRFGWDLEATGQGGRWTYSGEVRGPRGQFWVEDETMHLEGTGKRFVREADRGRELALRKGALPTGNARGSASDFHERHELREFVADWTFYGAFQINDEKIRRSVPLEPEPTLDEDAGNLSSVLHYFMTEHPQVFDELQTHMRSLVPGFERLNVKARGGPGEVLAFWKEENFDTELTLADLSDGILRLLCWMTVALHPNPPSLVCIDEPAQGVHPRTLPVLAGLFKKAAQRTQVILATHSSYFLTQFDLDQIAVLRKVDGDIEYIDVGESDILRDILDSFGADEIEAMHRSDELEQLP